LLTAVADWKPVVIPKTKEQQDDIRKAVGKSILFQGLDSDQLQMCIDAMFEKKFVLGETVIRQGIRCFRLLFSSGGEIKTDLVLLVVLLAGEPGDLFYVVDSGVLNCFVKKGNAEPILVKTYFHGESFGELALMYNMPRAASIVVCSWFAGVGFGFVFPF